MVRIGVAMEEAKLEQQPHEASRTKGRLFSSATEAEAESMD